MRRPVSVFLAAHLTPIFVALLVFTPSEAAGSASLSVRIPDDAANALAQVATGAGDYRLDYWPPQGVPSPNNTLLPVELLLPIDLRGLLPGTNYTFRLLFWNATLNAWPAFALTLPTAPEPATNLTIRVRKTVQVSWDQPKIGGVTGYKIKLHALSEPLASVRTLALPTDASPFRLPDLTPGASYRLELYSTFENVDSEVPLVQNFTTRPNTPGRMIVWFRNETTLLVLWQPPYPAGIYSNYKVSIDPPDAVESTLEVEKVGEPSGPAQAPFYGFLPGRNYNISVQTVSNGELSLPTTAQYRTVPLRPRNVTFDRRLVTSGSFEVRWEEPSGISVFDRYHVSVGNGRQPPVIVGRDDPRIASFGDGLEPGRTYQVLVKTLSGNVASWPVTVNITTRPLGVLNLTASLPSSGTEGVTSVSDLELSWLPNPRSQQDAYRVSYQEVVDSTMASVGADAVTALNAVDASGVLITQSNQLIMTSLLPGRNYSLSVLALMLGMESESTTVYQATRPSSPIIEELTPVHDGLNVSWIYDVTSKQDRYRVVYIRKDTGEPKTREVTEPRILIENLYPGASYQIKVFALSHGLQSEPYTHTQVVYPRPPRNVNLLATSSSSLRLTWSSPVDSLSTNYVVRYRTADNINWSELNAIAGTETELRHLTAGERYILQINSASHQVESLAPIDLQHTLYPNPVAQLTTAVDATNVTLTWQRPPGRVDMYRLVWYQAETDPVSPNGRQTDGQQRRSVVVGGDSNQSYIDTLFPGTLYVIEMTSISYGVESNKTFLTLRTLPLITSDIVIVKRHESNSLTLRYTPTPSSISRFNSYRFSLTDSTKKAIVKEKTIDDPDRKVEFDDLVPGRLYEISAWTVSGGVTSHPVLRQDRLYPDPASSINATDIGDTHLTLSWKAPSGDWSSFELEYLDYNNRLIKASTADTFITITNLSPHRNYTFMIYTRSGIYGSAYSSVSVPVSSSFRMTELGPGEKWFRAVEIQPRQVRFEWTLPSRDQNSVLMGFTVSSNIFGSQTITTRDFPPDSSSGAMTGLFPGKTYLFRIRAKMKTGSGSASGLVLTMPIWAPPRPLNVPEILAKTATTANIQFEKDLFSDEFGEVIGYTIIVSENNNEEEVSRLFADKKELVACHRWKDVQGYDVWPPYQAVEQYNPFVNSTVEVFTVGAEKCNSVVHLLDYCNGPLKPGTTYRFKVRAFTAEDKFTDTYYSAPVTTEIEKAPSIEGASEETYETVDPSSSLVLKCTENGSYPVASSRWYVFQNQDAFKTDLKHPSQKDYWTPISTSTNELYQINKVQHLTELTVRKAGNSSATYMCEFENSFGIARKLFFIKVETSKTKLRVHHNESYAVHEGDQLSLNCEKEQNSTKTNDIRHFAWRWKPNSFVQTLERDEFFHLSILPGVEAPTEVSYDGTSGTLKLVSRLRWSNITRNASGTYFCNEATDDEIVIRNLFHVNVTAGQLLNETSQISTKTKATVSVASVILLALLLTIVLYVVYRRRKEATRLGIAHQNLVQSLEGNLSHINPDTPLDDQVELLPYARTWEFPEDSLFLEKQIGCGHFGRVIKARAIGIIPSMPSETIEVAVKMVKSRGDVIELKSLIAELKILVHLGSHLNVVNLLGAVTKNIEKGIVMVIVEYCRNGNLKDFLINNRRSFINELDDDGNLLKSSLIVRHENSSPAVGKRRLHKKSSSTKSGARDMRSCVITTSDLVEWSFEIASGMSFLAQKKVIHGDLAARNVLLADDNVVKIADFGLARKFCQDSNYIKKGKEPMPVKWMAIESIQDRRFSSKSDVWSFGVTLWELFSLGHEPYIEIELSQLLRCLLVGYRLAKPKLAPKIIGDIMSSCWQENPDKRPTFDCLKQDLGRLLDPDLLAMYQMPYDRFGYITIPNDNPLNEAVLAYDQQMELTSLGYLELKSSIGSQSNTLNSDCIALSLLSTSPSFDSDSRDVTAGTSDKDDRAHFRVISRDDFRAETAFLRRPEGGRYERGRGSPPSRIPRVNFVRRTSPHAKLQQMERQRRIV